MKVVLFCGGMGTRLREFSDTIPKPMVPIGPRPIIWHLMRYYAHFGHKEFILCLGFGSEQIRDYFLNYKESDSNDFVLRDGGSSLELLGSDIQDWTITFVETGLHSNIGERLVAVRELVEGERYFLANYSDGLSDIVLPTHIARVIDNDATAGFAAVRPAQSLHAVSVGDDSLVRQITPLSKSGLRVNGGFFVLGRNIFDYIEPGDELVEKPFQRLIEKKRLVATNHNGFWAPMDTLKDKIRFDRSYAQGDRPWEVWK